MPFEIRNIGGLLSSNKSPKLLMHYFFLLVPLITISISAQALTVEDALSRSGHSRGIAVVLGDSECAFALELANKSELIVYVQLGLKSDLRKACEIVDHAGLYGTRIYVEQGNPSRIHLADNVVDLLVDKGGNSGVPKEEILRVINPNGRAFVGGKELTKPFPKGSDDWGHPSHGPDNNRFSRDTVIKAPYLTQYFAKPHNVPKPIARVGSHGRVFLALGHSASNEREIPYLNTLWAVNGYNGVMIWKRPIPPGIMVDRNTLIATPDTLYIADDESCKMIEAHTGKLKGEIILSTLEGTFWKWMAIEGDVLYAVVGKSELLCKVAPGRGGGGGHPMLDKEFKRKDHPWGFGKTLIAYDLKAGRELWRHTEKEPVDCRAVCMAGGRIYAFRMNSYLVCINAADGKEVWRVTPTEQPDLFSAVTWPIRKAGSTRGSLHRYLMHVKDVLVFRAGKYNGNMGVSASDGKVIWKKNTWFLATPSGRIPSGWGVLDASTGKVLKMAKSKFRTHACTTVTGCPDGLFSRGPVGTGRGNFTDEGISDAYEVFPFARPDCLNSVMPSCGYLYLTPFPCQCNVEMLGMAALGSAGSFTFNQEAKDAVRLEKIAGNPSHVKPFAVTGADWPTYRRSNDRQSTTPAVVSTTVGKLWQLDGIPNVVTTAPVVVGTLAIVGRSNGQVLALNTNSGNVEWKAYTGGAINFPPAIMNGRAYVGAGDGYAYCLEVATGKILWRFRCAPEHRKIHVYGKLLSTWPAASGVLVEDGKAYVAAGIASHDGTHVYALDAITGKIIWQDNKSGHIEPKFRGPAVQGHLLSHNGILYLSAGYGTGIAAWDMKDGRMLRDFPKGKLVGGRELYLYGSVVYQAGNPLYMNRKNERRKHSWMYVRSGISVQGDRTIFYTAPNEGVLNILCYKKGGIGDPLPKVGKTPKAKPLWSAIPGKADRGYRIVGRGTESVVVAKNTVLASKRKRLFAFDIKDGKVLWETVFSQEIIYWGLAVDRDGRVLVTLLDGRVICLGKGGKPLQIGK